MSDTQILVREWALYVYFGANVPEIQVREAAVENLLQLARVGSSEHVAVAAQLHLPGKCAYRYVMPERPPGSYSEFMEPVETIPNEDSADPRTIEEFFKWASKECPAKEIILIVWGHGYGLDDYLPLGARPFWVDGPCPPDEKTLAGKKEHAESAHKIQGAAVSPYTEASQTDEKALSLESERTESINIARRNVTSRYIGAHLVNIILDECHHVVLPNKALACAALASKAALPSGQELAILGLDACTMAMIEIWSELQGCAQIGIASEAQEPDASFPYDRILARLILQPYAKPEQAAKMIVDAYVESYAFQSDTFVTLSACDLSVPKDGQDKSALGLLLQNVKRLADALTHAATYSAGRRATFRARNASPIFDPDGFIDLARFCQILEFTLDDQDVRSICCEVRACVGKFIEYARYSPLDPTLRISQTTGLSIWFPPWLENPVVDIPEEEASIAYLISGYEQTVFARATGWHLFLQSLWQTRQCEEPCPDR